MKPLKTSNELLPALAGSSSSFKASVADFFLCALANKHTQKAYANDLRILNEYLQDLYGITLEDAAPIHLGAFRKHLEDAGYSPAGIQRKIATIRAFYGHLASSGVIPFSPAANLKAPRLVRDQGATPIFNGKADVESFINSFDEPGLLNLRNRALFSVLFFSMARISAVCNLNFEDISQLPSHTVLTFREKRGRVREIPLNSYAADILFEYLRLAGITEGPVFRSGITKGSDELSDRRMTRHTVHYLLKARLKKLKLNKSISSHSFRGSACTFYCEQPGATLENASKILGHRSINTTKLYDRRKNSIPLLEVERLSF